MTAKPKTIKVKAKAVIEECVGVPRLSHIRTYGEYGAYHNATDAEYFSTNHYDGWGPRPVAVDCTITVTLKGKRP